MAAGHLTAEDMATARATGAVILADFESFLREIGDWRAFVPPTLWSVLDLPADWAN